MSSAINQKETYGMLYLHLSVLLFGMAGLFGKLIALPALIIVLGRVFFASLALGSILGLHPKLNFKINNLRTGIGLIFLGLLLAFHWFAFFQAIQLTTVALGLITFATFPVFAALLEPLLLKEKFEKQFIFLALTAGLGVYLAAFQELGDRIATSGVIWGILSGLSFALLSIGNRKLLQHTGALSIAFYEDVVAFLVLLPALFLMDLQWTLHDLLWLVVLGTLFTAGAHYLFIRSFKSVTTRTASIVSTLEPVYGILFAWLILNEIPGLNTVLGCLIIIGVSLYISLRTKRMA
jgi:drug/metabolite transporter (DMT)-like permease